MRLRLDNVHHLVLVAMSVFSSGLHAGGIDLSMFGSLGLQTRWYSEDAVYSGQRSHVFSLSAETTFLLIDDQGRSFTFTPYFRYDATDSERSLVDIREAYLLAYGDIGENEWELRLGIDKVFWGVAELHNLVNIVNQTDWANDPDQKSRLGQPMVRLALTGPWGTVEILGLPYHRKRNYPGPGGRLRGPVVDNDRASYEDGQEDRHLDLAARYQGYIGPLDIGFSVFRGTSRDPTLMWQPGVLLPHYERIRQYGVDAQLTTGPWILKMEAIHRSGMKNRFPALVEEDYSARLIGGEYTFYGVFDSNRDVGLIIEWISDDREERSTSSFQNDLFVAARFSFNDIWGTEAVIGATYDLDSDSQVVDARIERRLSDNWSFEANATVFRNAENDPDVGLIRHDDYIALALEYHF